MCGICGQINKSNNSVVDRHQIEKMSSKLIHRGPDGSDYYSTGGIGLAHRRLSILDTSSHASQPMVDKGTGVVITYNGEIYNYIEIRKRLRHKGHSFRSTGDTEVLLKAYLEWGHEILNIISGMFAFVIFDPRINEVFCARDPFGQKPFFYTYNKHRFIFSSELTSLLTHSDVHKELNLEAISEYLLYESFVASQTPIKHIKKLPAGFALTYKRDHNNFQIWKYWHSSNNQFSHSNNSPNNDDIEQLVDVLRDSVSRHLRSDVPLGIYLSGGIDSSLMTLLASDILGGENIHTFTIGNPEKSFDESDVARRTAEILGTNHHELFITPEDSLNSISDVLDHMDEPLSDPGLIAVSQVAKFASNYVKVAISGDGGDELFCGYPPFHKWELSNILSKLPDGLINNYLGPLVNKLPAQDKYMGLFYKAQIFTRGVGYSKEIRNSRWLASFLPHEIKELMLDGESLLSLSLDNSGYKNIYKHVLDIRSEYSGLDDISKLSMEYQYSYLTNIICNHTDKANMQYSLEARSPYLDVVASQYINNLPNSWKLKNGKGKYILRQYLKSRLGPHVSSKKKQGFTVPLALWFKNELKEFCLDNLSEESISNSGVFNYNYVNKIYQNHLLGKENNYKKLWTILTFINWQKKVII
jgi:asparagine synthase (glutamine-hydrolysing)